jgi:hypothetical protein
MSVTSSQQQSNVEDNIADVLNGAQEYAIGDKRIKRTNLKDLMEAQAKLPLATKESLQSICDLYGVSFEFVQKGRKMGLTSIFTPLRSTYLYPDGKLEDSQKLMKNASRWVLHPNANHKLEEVNNG